MKKRDDIYRKLNDEFGRCLAGAFQSKFGIAVETNWNILSSCRITTRTDERPLTMAQREFIGAYENGYYQAAHEAAGGS